MAFPQGIAFRATAGFVTDGANDDAEIGTTANYPRTTAQGNTVGWEQAPAGTRDRNSSNDPRLAGVAFVSSGQSKDFRIDLPATGDYSVRAAFGDTFNTHVKAEFFDGSTSLGVVCDGNTLAGNRYFDATGVLSTSAADWVANNAAAPLTFATTIFRIRVSGTTGSGMVAYLYIESAGGGTTTLTPSLFTNTQTFYAPTVTPGSVSLTPSLFTNSQTFHSPTVSATYDLTPTLYTNTQTFFAATVSPGEVTLTPALFTNEQTFYGPTVSQGDRLLPSLFTNTQTFFGPTVTVGAVTLTPDLFANDNRFFAATVTGGVQVAVSTKPSGAPGHRIKFRGRFYDSQRDRYRLARDVEAFLVEKQEESPQPQKKPRKRVIRTEVAAISAPKVVLDTREIDELTEVLTALKARDSQLQAYVAQLKAMNEALMAEEEEFLMMVA